MKNKFRRSMTSVLLAASLLFSSQSVIAFADYGSKSDTSDLSPVQESVENATEEQQEDPSLSVEPVIGESTEAPVAAPMMARANAPVSYSAPRLDDYHTYFEENYSSNFASIAVYTRVPNSIEADGKEQENYFIQGSGWQVYKALPVEGWIFKNWSYSLTKNGGSNDLGNLKDLLDRYTFSDADSDWYAPYSDSSDNKDRISINAINRELKNGLTAFDTLHHSIYANYNPLVTVNVGENGTVTYNNIEVSHEDSGEKVEVEYATSPEFTITPNDGYKVASVTADGIIPVDENGKCTLPPVTEPTTLYVEFEKAEDEDTITKDKIDGAVIVTVECDNLPEHTHQYSLSVNGTDDGEYPNYKITKTSDESATLHLLKDGWLHTFISQPGLKNHQLSDDSSNLINIQLTFDKDSGEWKLPENAKRYDVTIKVKCSDVQEKVVVYACYDGVMEKQPIFQGKASHGSKLIDYLKEKELKIKEGYTIEEGWYKKDSFPNEYLFNESDTVSGWTNVYVKCFKNPDENIINNLLDVTLNCENPDHPEEYAKSKTYSDLLPNSYTIGEVKNNDGTYTCDITINPSLYLADFYKVNGGIDHSLVTRDPETGSVTVPLYYDFQNKQWKLVNGEDSPVTFLVSCTTQKPIDNPEWKDISALFNNYVTVDCTTNGHDPRYYSLTEGEVEIGEVYSAVPIVGEGSTTYFVPITFKTPDSIKARVISDYDSNTPNDHILWSGFIPASITLRYDNENKVWVNEDVKNVLFTVTCTTGGGTIDPNPNPGGGGDNDDDDDRYTGDNTVTRTINDDDVPLNDRPTNTTTIDDEDVPLADLPDDTVTIDDGEVPLKANPSTGDSLPFAAMAAAALSLGGVIVLNRKKK